MADTTKQMQNEMDAVLNRLEKIATRMEQLTMSVSMGANISDACRQYQQIVIQTAIPHLSEACRKLGSEELIETCAKVNNVFVNLGKVIEQFGKFKKPQPGKEENDCYMQIGQFLNGDMCSIDKIRSGIERDNPFFNHISAISQSISAVGWFTYPEPVTFIQEMLRASQFYTNRILASNKNDKLHAEFVNAWNDVLSTLCDYVRDNFPSGPTWNFSAPSPCTAEALRQALMSSNAASALHSELNKGLSLAQSQLKSSRPAKPSICKKSVTSPSKSEDSVAKINLSGLRWTVEGGHGQSEICVNVTEMKHSVYIMNCSRSMIKICGPKVNSITIDGCVKCDMLIESGVVSGLECINCRNIRVQALEVLPTVTVDKSDGFHLFLSDASDCNLYTSLSSEVTLSVKDFSRGGEYIEHPIPSQLVTNYKKGHSVVQTTVASNPCAYA